MEFIDNSSIIIQGNFRHKRERKNIPKCLEIMRIVFFLDLFAPPNSIIVTYHINTIIYIGICYFTNQNSIMDKELDY